MPRNSFEFEVEEEGAGLRLDVYLAEQIEDASRSFIQKAIKDKRARINGAVCARPSRAVAEGDVIEIELPPAPAIDLSPENIPLDILYEDGEVVVVNKAAGLVVHPAPGHYSGTLVNALLFHCPDFQRPGEDAERPGIVHRLDRFTSGVMVAAKTQRAFVHLAEQARGHTFDRRYLALVRGEFPEDRGVIRAAIGRSLADRARMSVTGVRGREAATHFETLERFGAASLVALTLETGRTHQIRVHLRFAGRPVLGDPVYGCVEYGPLGVSPEVAEALSAFEGQALHAGELGFEHPVTGERMRFSAPPPATFQRALDALRRWAGNRSASA